MHTGETADFFPWPESNASDGIMDFKMPEVKEESHTEFSSLLSPPSSPFIAASALTSQSVRQRVAKSESPRIRPYPELSREDTIGMSGTSGSGFDNWSNRSGSNERRSSDGGPHYQSAMYNSSQLSRSSSASSSSFNGAVGLGIGSSGTDTRFVTMSPQQSDVQLASMSWHQSQMSINETSDLSLYPGVAGDIPYHYSSDADHGGFPSGTPSSSTAIYSYDDTTTPIGDATTYNDSTSHSLSSVECLHRKIAELEERHHHDQEHIRVLQAQLASSSSRNTDYPYSPPASAFFKASWAARTTARTKYLCSLNRAGNALCAWHDSRRERRAYPPRNAPRDTLNCGCTYEEALFEESLSRHKVGSYLPGESVRMDPALRNPLLQLLKHRYGYQDGDFERDPFTGDWVSEDGHEEGHEHWERLLASGVNPRRARGEQHRNTPI
ncbi:hypothetical protein F5051DRAFT_440569 [Lentinula edodes]|nr:hypothetical protein F5051DRAFT_440569 [Lentinula edodes]